MVSKLTQDERNTQLQPLFGKGSNNFPSLHRLSKIFSYPERMDHGEGQRRHLQGVHLQRLQPSIWLHDQGSSEGGQS